MASEDARTLVEFMFEMAQLSWHEIRGHLAGGHRKHHFQPTASLCPEAMERIRELEYDDIAEQMFRFRLAGTPRLWGYEVGDGIFHAVWWDPDHRVFPADPS